MIFIDNANIKNVRDNLLGDYKAVLTVYCSRYDKTLSDACASLADAWNESDLLGLSRFKPSDLDDFSAYQKKAFLGLLLQHV